MAGAMIGRASYTRLMLFLLLFAAILPRVLIPTGYMPDASRGITLMLCSGVGPAQITVDVGTTNHDRSDHDGGVQHQPCAFATAAMPILAGVPPVLLAEAIAYVVRHGIEADRFALPPAAPRLRPPLRGPPHA